MSVPKVHLGALILTLLAVSWRLPFTKPAADSRSLEEQRQPESHQGEPGSSGTNAQRTELSSAIPRSRNNHHAVRSGKE
jgi:hypothetical protein